MPKRSKHRASLPWRIAWRLTLLLIVVLVVYQFWFFGRVVWWIWADPTTTAFMEARLETMREQDPEATLKHQWVPYSGISANLKRALIAAEDAKFLDHEGFDWKAIQKTWAGFVGPLRSK